MIIYLIVKGDYYERVCAVTEKKENAERLRKMFSSENSVAEIKKYNTKDSNEIAVAGYKPFRITSTTDGACIRIEEDIDLDYNDLNNISLNTFGNYICRIAAKDKEHAKKIFRALLAEHKYENEPY